MYPTSNTPVAPISNTPVAPILNTPVASTLGGKEVKTVEVTSKLFKNEDISLNIIYEIFANKARILDERLTALITEIIK